jgi:hypothetical protein
VRGVLIGIGLAIAVWAVAVIVLIALGRRSQARELATLIPNLLVLFRGLLRDPRVPRSAKLWLGFAVVWIASPIDLVPEFIPIAGPLDDRRSAGASAPAQADGSEREGHRNSDHTGDLPIHEWSL